MRNPSTMCPCTSAPTSRSVRTAPRNRQHAARRSADDRHAPWQRPRQPRLPHAATRERVRANGACGPSAARARVPCRVVRVVSAACERAVGSVILFVRQVSWAFTTKDYDITILVVRDDDGKETQVRTDGARRRRPDGRRRARAAHWYSCAATVPVRDRDELNLTPTLRPHRDSDELKPYPHQVL